MKTLEQLKADYVNAVRECGEVSILSLGTYAGPDAVEREKATVIKTLTASAKLSDAAIEYYRELNK